MDDLLYGATPGVAPPPSRQAAALPWYRAGISARPARRACDRHRRPCNLAPARVGEGECEGAGSPTGTEQDDLLTCDRCGFLQSSHRALAVRIGADQPATGVDDRVDGTDSLRVAIQFVE